MTSPCTWSPTPSFCAIPPASTRCTCWNRIIAPDPISEPLLLSLYEGKTLDFEVGTPQGTQIVKGKVIRSGYTPHDYFAMNRYGQQYDQGQMAAAAAQPIIEVNGQLRFSLPGTPVFPSLTDED